MTDNNKDYFDYLFDELDKLLETASENVKIQKRDGKIDPIYPASLELINLMMEEAVKVDIAIKQLPSGVWSAEVRYRGIRFVCFSKTKLKFWEDVINQK